MLPANPLLVLLEVNLIRDNPLAAMKMADDEFKDFVAVSLLLLCPLSHYCSFSFRCIAWFHNHRTKSRASSRKLPPFVGASLKKLRTRPSGICCTFAYFVPLIQQSFVSTSFFKQGEEMKKHRDTNSRRGQSITSNARLR